MKPGQFPFKIAAASALLVVWAANIAASQTRGLLDVDVRRLNSDDTVNLGAAYGGKVILVVNTASKCAFTGQYEGLESLYARYRDRGLVVLGFPSNDFGGQEPGTEQQIRDFCRLTYSVRFPMLAKTQVREGSADTLFTRLGESAGRYPKWNFHKYLIGRDGRLVDDFLSATAPLSDALVDAIEGQL